MTEMRLGGEEEFESDGGRRWGVRQQGVRLVMWSDGRPELTSGTLCIWKCVSSSMRKEDLAERARIRFVSWYLWDTGSRS